MSCLFHSVELSIYCSCLVSIKDTVKYSFVCVLPGDFWTSSPIFIQTDNEYEAIVRSFVPYNIVPSVLPTWQPW